MHSTQSRQSRTIVLVKVHGDGFVEVYGENLDVRIVQGPTMASTDGQILAEEYIDTLVPQRFRGIDAPGKLAAMHMIRPISPADIAYEQELRGAYRAVSDLLAKPSGIVMDGHGSSAEVVVI